MTRPTGWIQIALGRSSPLRGALCASKLLAQFVEQSSILMRHTEYENGPRMGARSRIWRARQDSNLWPLPSELAI